MDPGWFAEQQRQQMEQRRRAQMAYDWGHRGRGQARAPRGAGTWFGYGIVWLILAAILAFIVLALAR